MALKSLLNFGIERNMLTVADNQIHIYIYTYIQTYTYIHIYTYMCISYILYILLCIYTVCIYCICIYNDLHYFLSFLFQTKIFLSKQTRFKIRLIFAFIYFYIFSITHPCFKITCVLGCNLVLT